MSAILVQNWLRADALREIRTDGLLTGLCLGIGLYVYGQRWPLLLVALAARGFFISFLDNIYHSETPVRDVFYAKNLALPRPWERLLLHFNLHGVHHVNPAIPWIDLRKTFNAQQGQFQGKYFIAARAQLRGPIALQELPGDR